MKLYLLQRSFIISFISHLYTHEYGPSYFFPPSVISTVALSWFSHLKFELRDVIA